MKKRQKHEDERVQLDTSLSSFIRNVVIETSHEVHKQLIQELSRIQETERAKATKDQDSAYMTRKEVMKLLRRSNSTMVDWDKKGILVPVRIGGKCLYSRKEVMSLLNE